MTHATAHPDRRLISSEDVQGTDVYGVGNEAIGQIDHLLIERLSGRVSYAVMSFGGFLGLGLSHYPDTLDRAEIRHGIAGLPDRHYRRAAQRCARFSDNSWEDRDWETKTHQHYAAPVYWEDAGRIV